MAKCEMATLHPVGFRADRNHLSIRPTWIRSKGEVPVVFVDHHSELSDVATESGSDYCRPSAGHEGLVGKRSDAFQVYLSQLVIDEVSAGDATAASERLKLLRHLPLLDIPPRSRS